MSDRGLEGDSPAGQAARDLLRLALGVKINVDLGRAEDAAAEAERAGAVVALLVAALAEAKKPRRP